VADGYTLDVTLPGWPLLAMMGGLGAAWLAHRWARRERTSAVTESPPSAERDGDVPSRDVAASAGPGRVAVGSAVAAPVDRIAVRSPRAITLIAVDEISHIEADGRYARVHAAGGEHLTQHSLAQLDQMLDTARFVRVHRSTIVNLDRIRSLRTTDYRDFELRLEDGAKVRLSRTHRTRLEAALGLRI
jgi:DNA-binding LytR/AlgR family response regulator